MFRLRGSLAPHLLALFCLLLAFPRFAEAAATSDEAAFDTAREAYIFGYPLLAMETSKWVMTRSASTSDKAAVNEFHHARTFPDASFTDVVSPNADTLYSQAWLDLTVGPLVLSVPDLDPDRYYVMQCLNGWTDVFTSVGTRTTGNGSSEYLLTGPGWSGTVPTSMTQLASPTNLVWILGRTETHGAADYEAVHAIQAQYGLRPLNPGIAAPTPSNGTDIETPPAAQMDRLDDPETFYTRLCLLMAENPPSSSDRPLVDRMALLGMIPGQPYDPATLSDDIRLAVEKGFAAGRSEVIDESKKPQGTMNGAWNVMPGHIGDFGTDYLFRAVIARVAIGANLPQEAIYSSARTDLSGNELRGSSKYTIRFEKGQLPPVRAFWSITMYNDKQYFVDNPIDRYAIGDRDALRESEDGSVTIYVQRESPGDDLESNWLPAPAENFSMIMRLYLPDKSILAGTWPMPALRNAEEANEGSGGCAAAGAMPAIMPLLLLLAITRGFNGRRH